MRATPPVAERKRAGASGSGSAIDGTMLSPGPGDPPFPVPICANLIEGDDATVERNPYAQTTIDCWAKIPAIAPCEDAWVTEGKNGVARSPAA